MAELVEFDIPRHTTHNNGDYAMLDAMCNITVKLHEIGMTYAVDWSIHGSHYNPDGHKIIILEFRNPSDAMIAKIYGVANG